MEKQSYQEVANGYNLKDLDYYIEAKGRELEQLTDGKEENVNLELVGRKFLERKILIKTRFKLKEKLDI